MAEIELRVGFHRRAFLHCKARIVYAAVGGEAKGHETVTGFEILLYAGVGSTAYAMACNRLSAVAQPLRLRWADEGESLLSEPDIPRASRRKIEALLDNVLSTREAWRIALVVLPTAAAWVIYDIVTGRRLPLDAIPVRLAGRYASFTSRGLFLRLANSPAATVIFFMLLSLLLMFFMPAARLLSWIKAEPTLPSFHHGDHRHAA